MGGLTWLLSPVIYPSLPTSALLSGQGDHAALRVLRFLAFHFSGAVMQAQSPAGGDTRAPMLFRPISGRTCHARRSAVANRKRLVYVPLPSPAASGNNASVTAILARRRPPCVA